VESEDEAKKLIAQIKAAAKFEDSRRRARRTTGSAENGGDLDWAKASTYVPEFSAALQKLKPGEMTDTPVKTQFGYPHHQARGRARGQFPNFDDVKDKIKENMKGEKVASTRTKLRKSAKTDYKFVEDMPPSHAPARRPMAPPPAPAGHRSNLSDRFGGKAPASQAGRFFASRGSGVRCQVSDLTPASRSARLKGRMPLRSETTRPAPRRARLDVQLPIAARRDVRGRA
jgi:hypothetical protein